MVKRYIIYSVIVVLIALISVLPVQYLYYHFITPHLGYFEVKDQKIKNAFYKECPDGHMICAFTKSGKLDSDTIFYYSGGGLKSMSDYITSLELDKNSIKTKLELNTIPDDSKPGMSLGLKSYEAITFKIYNFDLNSTQEYVEVKYFQDVKYQAFKPMDVDLTKPLISKQIKIKYIENI